MTGVKRGGMDEIDRIIVGALAENPRLPYSDIAARLDDRGHQMSAEGVRRRVSKLLEQTNPFFLLSPTDHDWNLVRLAVVVTDDPGAKDAVMDELDEMPFWFLGRGFGTYDFYAVSTAPTTAAVDELIRDVREIDGVAEAHYSVETERRVDVNKYFPIDRED